jgi:hypothetical protein
MKNFIKAKSEDGEDLYINLNMVSIIRETDSGFSLNIFGNRFNVDKDCKEVISLVKNQA